MTALDTIAPSDVLLRAALDANLPCIIIGPPGVGKTATIEAIAADDGYHLETLVASARDATTILGIPMPTADRTHTVDTVPQWAQRIMDADRDGRPTMLFLDEITSVPPSVQAALTGLLVSRRTDSWSLPATTRMVAAANPPEMAAGGWGLEPPIANRLLHIPWALSEAQWAQWANAQPSPTLHLVAEYVTAVPGTLLAVPASLTARSGPWPSPRSWTLGAQYADALNDRAAVTYAIGAESAAPWMAWTARRDVPAPADIIAGTATLPSRDTSPDARRATLSALGTYGTQPDVRESVVRYLLREIVTGNLWESEAVLPALTLAESGPDYLSMLPDTLQDAIAAQRTGDKS